MFLVCYLTAVVAVVVLLIIGIIFARLYRRASAEQAFVRTGPGGQKVMMSGGAVGEVSAGNVSGGNLAEQALSAALAYRTQAPLIDSLLNEIGLSGGSLNALTTPLNATTTVDVNHQTTIKEE